MPEPGRTGVVRLEFHTPQGTSGTVIAEGGPWTAPGPGLAERPLYASDGSTLMVQRAVTADGGRIDGTAHRMLQNEIRAALRVGRRHGAAHPDCLPRLVGYDLDAESPYLLCPPVAGRPVAGLAGQLLLGQRHGFQTALFRALVLLSEAEVVHAGLRPEVVHWDGRQVRLTGFGRSAAVGESYREDVASLWMPPAAVRDAVADPHDDVWAAGLVVAHVVTGLPVEQLAGGAGVPAESALASLLDGVFRADPRRRPGAAQILRRLGDQSRAEAAALDDAALDAGRAAFDAERAKKAGPPAPAPAAEPPSAPGDPGRLSPALLLALGVVLIGLTLIGWRVFG
ncbi:hypothetical protein AB0M36_23260 [Actinoplanes sp. NPDC051346]|uniref:hypothetical protein n=1 Tax=Actinoplanes sp. NPDC051346 TaxID=3155048 RepID=UPI003433BA64